MSSTTALMLPTYSAYQTYSPENQAIYNQSQQTQLGLAKLANQQTAKVSGILGTNVDLSSGNVDKYVNDHWQSGFSNQWDRDQASLDQSLADKKNVDKVVAKVDENMKQSVNPILQNWNASADAHNSQKIVIEPHITNLHKPSGATRFFAGSARLASASARTSFNPSAAS